MPVSQNPQTAQNLAIARPQPDDHPMGRLSRGCRRLHVVLAADFGSHHLVLRLGRAAHRRRYRRPRLAAALVLYGQSLGSVVGHAQHGDAGHPAGAGDGGAGGLSGGPQHHAERHLHPAGRTVHHRCHPLDQLADLGPAAGRHHRPGRLCRADGHRLPLDRFLRQAALRGDRGDRREARSRRSPRPAPAAGR
jgi:hypothetical protein